MRNCSAEFRSSLLSLKEFIEYAAGSLPAPPLAYPIEDAPAITGIPRTKIFEAIRTKQLTVRRSAARPLSNILNWSDI